MPLAGLRLAGELESHLLLLLPFQEDRQRDFVQFDVRDVLGLDLALLGLLALLGVAETAVLVKYNLALVVEEVLLLDDGLVQHTLAGILLAPARVERLLCLHW